MNLFLEGPIGIGKSTLIRTVLNNYSYKIAGYMTQRLFIEKKLSGFRVISVRSKNLETSEVYRPDMSGVFMLNGHRNTSVLEDMIIKTENDAQNDKVKLVFLDEIGGIELTSETFTKSLYRLLSGNKPCMGVLKSMDNLRHSKKHLSLSNEYIKLNHDLRNFIQSTGQVLSLTDDNADCIRAQLNEYLQNI